MHDTYFSYKILQDPVYAAAQGGSPNALRVFAQSGRGYRDDT